MSTHDFPLDGGPPPRLPQTYVRAIGPLGAVGLFAAGLLVGVALVLAVSATSPTPSVSKQVSATGEPDAAIPGSMPTALPVASTDTAATLAGTRSALRLGRSDAPVQVVVFSDPRCPYCAQLASGAEAQLKRQYVASGKVAITYRHFPVLGEASVLGALAIECAARQAQFEAFHRLVYERSGGFQTRAELEQLASALKLDGPAFGACMDDAGTWAAVQADLDAGRRLSVQGTPTLFVNGIAQPGALPWDTLKPLIERLLAGGKA